MDAMQHCPRCDKDLPLDDYHPDKQGKAGHYCRLCVVEYKREWRRARGQVTREQYADARRRRCDGPGCDKTPTSKKARYCSDCRETRPRELSARYRAVHHRIGRARGKASAQQCTHCPAQAEQWAYDHADPDEVTGETDRGVVAVYSLDLAHYLPLCRSCHVKFDNADEAGDGYAYLGSPLHAQNERRRTGAGPTPQPRLVSSW